MMHDTPEALCLESEALSIRILPGRGGKIASIYSKQEQFELLYQPLHGYPPLRAGMPFSAGDASGFDDVFPSMGETYRGALAEQPLTLPDHGEIWTYAMAVESASRHAATLHATGTALPYAYRKQIRLDGRTLKLQMHIRNTGHRPLPLVWVCHCLMRLEEDTWFAFPQECRRIVCLPGCTWPSASALDADIDDPAYRFHHAPPEGRAMKFYFRDPVVSGQCAAHYPASGMRADMRFDTDCLPWLGFWITTGGYRGEKNFAFEPASAWYDTWTEAERQRRLPLIAPGGEARIGLDISLVPERQDSGFSP
ncbi:MAG: hypothetical protein ACI4OY_12165 [Aristaeellaceae bacterium]